MGTTINITQKLIDQLEIMNDLNRERNENLLGILDALTDINNTSGSHYETDMSQVEEYLDHISTSLKVLNKNMSEAFHKFTK